MERNQSVFTSPTARARRQFQPVRVSRFVAIAGVVVIGALPKGWLLSAPYLRLVWLIALGVLTLVSALSAVRSRTHTPRAAQAQWVATWTAALVLWLLAPLGGMWGLFLRLPVLQIAWLARPRSRAIRQRMDFPVRQQSLSTTGDTISLVRAEIPPDAVRTADPGPGLVPAGDHRSD